MNHSATAGSAVHPQKKAALKSGFEDMQINKQKKKTRKTQHCF